MQSKILITKTPDFDTFKSDMLSAGLAEEVPDIDVDGGTRIQVTGTHTAQKTVWVDSNGDPVEPKRDEDGNITNDAENASHIYIVSVFTDRDVQMSDYVTFDPGGEEIYVGDLKTGFSVGNSEVIWDSSQDEDAPGNVTAGFAGHEVPTKDV
jgi:hypothetical protein